jgi:threonine dehydrogenase-like Zn-dependent dehydrogenase
MLHRSTTTAKLLQRCSIFSSQLRYASDNKAVLPNSVGVIGAGQMGTGIALVSAMHAKTNVVLIDANKDSLNNAINFMSMSFIAAIY